MIRNMQLQELDVYNDKNYVYLVNTQEQTNCVLGIVKDDLQEVADVEEFKQVMPLILDNVDMSIFENGGEND